jgi:hypothetical protein
MRAKERLAGEDRVGGNGELLLLEASFILNGNTNEIDYRGLFIG